jgi:hypothetical protein
MNVELSQADHKIYNHEFFRSERQSLARLS